MDNLQEDVKINEKLRKMDGGDLPQGMRDGIKKMIGLQEDTGKNEAMMQERLMET